MPIERFSHQESDFDSLLRTKESAGWHFMGREGLTRTEFSKEAKFEEVPFQTEEEIKNMYLKIARQQDPTAGFEVELVLDEGSDKLKKLREISTSEKYKSVINNLHPADRKYFVFVRKIKKQA